MKARPEGQTMKQHSAGQRAKGPSQRQLRVGELVRHALAEVFSRGEVDDPVLVSHILTFPEVRMSPDLKLATAYVMPLGGQDIKPVLVALERNRKILRTQIAKRLNLKFAPEIRFRRDESFEEYARIDRLLADERVRRDTGRLSPLIGDDEGDESASDETAREASRTDEA
jgi:ribosome-binding factor A